MVFFWRSTRLQPISARRWFNRRYCSFIWPAIVAYVGIGFVYFMGFLAEWSANGVHVTLSYDILHPLSSAQKFVQTFA